MPENDDTGPLPDGVDLYGFTWSGSTWSGTATGAQVVPGAATRCDGGEDLTSSPGAVEGSLGVWGIPWPAYQPGDPAPMTVAAAGQVVRGTAPTVTLTYRVCMSRSTVDTDGDGIPDKVDVAPAVAGDPLALGGAAVAGNVIAAQTSVRDGVTGLTDCPATASSPT